MPFLFFFTVKDGQPTDEELQWLATEIADSWQPLGRQLGMNASKITRFDRENTLYTEKPYKMLLHWTQRDGSAATYQVLYDALTHGVVEHRDLAEKMCLVETS